MMSKRRNVLVRMVTALAIFACVAFFAAKQLPAYDFKVIMAFIAVYLVSSVYEAWIYQDPDDYVVEDDDKKSYLYLQLSFLAALFFATIDFVEKHYTRVVEFEPYVIYLGFVLFVASCVLRWWGLKSIGRYYNPRVAVYRNHRLITDGAYAKVRHPIYLGTLLNSLAIPLVFNSWGALLIIVLFNVPALAYRINIEESFLAQKFGKEYLDYMERSKKLIPGIW